MHTASARPGNLAPYSHFNASMNAYGALYGCHYTMENRCLEEKGRQHEAD